MSWEDLVAEEARRFAQRAGIELEEAEQLLRTHGLNIMAVQDDESYD